MDSIETSAEPPAVPDWPVADWLGFDLPTECVPGVTENLAILSRHMARVRATLDALAQGHRL